jgi:hypothetical protein
MTTATELTPALWGIGCFAIGDELVTYPVSQADHGRDIGIAMKAIKTLGLGKGNRALVLSMLSQATQYWPVQIALFMSNVQLSLADASRFDAFRTAMFLRAMHYDVVLGINRDVLDGLDDVDIDYLELFSRVPVLAARAGAYERLRAKGLRPRWWLDVGPAIGVECDALAGAHVDADEWSIEVDNGEVLLTARQVRAASIDHLRTGVYGEIVADACACGRADPRIVPAR